MNKTILIKKAIEAQKASYSPYSHFKVGAALLTKNNKVYLGTNIENASYGLTMCAERSAIFNAISNGVSKKDIKAIAIVTNTKTPAKPCGACRQVMSEFFNDKVIIYLANNQGKVITTNITKLLPDVFLPSDLK